MNFSTMVAVSIPGAVGFLLAWAVIQPACIRLADYLATVLR